MGRVLGGRKRCDDVDVTSVNRCRMGKEEMMMVIVLMVFRRSIDGSDASSIGGRQQHDLGCCGEDRKDRR